MRSSAGIQVNGTEPLVLKKGKNRSSIIDKLYTHETHSPLVSKKPQVKKNLLPLQHLEHPYDLTLLGNFTPEKARDSFYSSRCFTLCAHQTPP